MDSLAGVKRPRTGTPDAPSKKKDRGTKKKKKTKPTTKNRPNESTEDNAHSLESTATADGQYMAKILSTFSKMEQSRFEAFKRVAFPSDAVSEYVAHCLAERQHHQQNPVVGPGSIFVGNRGDGTTPELQDLVSPGQEEEITTVVATLAKVYAQRLCAAAKAQAQIAKGQQGDSVGPIQPEHVLHAFQARQQQGQDPGFFLQPNDSTTIPSNGKDQVKRVAALAAQEEFDRVLEEFKEKEKQTKNEGTDSGQQSQKQSTDKSSEAKPMEEESDSGDEEEVELDMAKEMEKDMAGD